MQYTGFGINFIGYNVEKTPELISIIGWKYGNRIKKIQLTNEELSWSSITDILTKSFLFAEKDKLKVTYKDPENDEITICSDEDLKEACNLYMAKDLIKFFVYYSGNFKAKSPLRGSIKPSHEKVQRTSALEETKSIETESALKSSSTLTASQQQTTMLQVDVRELEEIFSEVLASTDVINKIQERIANLIKKNSVDASKSSEFSIETDFGRLSQYLMSKVNEIANKSHKELLSQSSPSLIEQSAFTPIEIKKPVQQMQFSSIKESPLSVSHFETVTKQCHDTLADIVNKQSDTKIAEFDQHKSFIDSAGFRFVMKFENGKAKFVPVIAVEKNESKPNEEKKSVEKEDEFSGKLLKDNMHDLDDDLPAPYDHKKVQKFEEGVTSQKFEKLLK